MTELIMEAGDIAFPHLGIYLKNVPQYIYIGSFSIALYGMIIAFGMLCGSFVINHEARVTGQDEGMYWDIFLYGVIISVACARIYYVVFKWDYYSRNPIKILALREGGLAIYGGVIGAFLTACIMGKLRKVSPLKILDTCMTGLLTGQIIGRWGNFTNREAFGEYTDSLFAMRLPLAAVRDVDISEHLRQMIPDGANFIQVSPTFLYESCWNVLVLTLLFQFRRRGLKLFTGEIFLLYLGGYGLGRFLIEGLRTDSLLLPGTQVAVSQLLAGLMVLLTVIVEIYMRGIRCHLKKKTNGE